MIFSDEGKVLLDPGSEPMRFKAEMTFKPEKIMHIEYGVKRPGIKKAKTYKVMKIKRYKASIPRKKYDPKKLKLINMIKVLSVRELIHSLISFKSN